MATRDQIILTAREMADAEGSSRWSDDSLPLLLDGVFTREWRGILNANRFYRVGLRTVTPSVSGRIALSALTDLTGDATEVFYRIIRMTDAEQFVYEEVSLDRYPLLATSSIDAGNRRVWWREGSYLGVLPKTAPVTVLVNHVPQLPSRLTAGTVEVDFPYGYEDVLSFELASLMLAKGGAELEGTGAMKTLAMDLRDSMLADIVRTSTDPVRMTRSDSPGDWAG